MKKFSALTFALLAACSQHRPVTPNQSGTPPAPSQSTTLAPQDVSWTQLVNATASGNAISKSGGQPWLDDAGGISAQSLTAGDGWLEVTVADTQAFRFVGLARPHQGVSSNAIDFAVRMQAGHADAYESGVWKADNTVVAGDVVRIAVEGGIVTYSKNGAAFYSSATGPRYPLTAAASLVDATAAVSGARIALDLPTPPAGSFVSSVTATPASNGATIAWETAVPADGQVQYGTSTSYGVWSIYNAAATTTHSVALTDLTAGTAYHFRVRSQDGKGNAVLSADAIFTTSGPTPTPTPAANRHRFCGWLQATGWVPIAQDPNYADFVAHADSFDAVHPTWYHLGSTTTLTPSFGEGDAQVLDHTTVGGKRTLLIPTIAAADGSEPQWASTMIHDATLRAQHEAAIVALVTAKHYDGIDLDYEHLPDADRDAFSQFAAELGAQLHAKGKTLSFAVGALITARFGHWDYDKLTQAADQLHVMGYDFHYLGSHPGPVAPLGWIQQVLAYINTIGGGGRAGKFILGLPNYGIAGSDGSTTTWFGSSMDSINLVGGSYDVTTSHMASCPLTNGTSMPSGRAPNATSASKGHVFFDDLVSHEEKVAAAQQAGLGGITYWTIGGEPDRPGPRSFFDMVRAYYPK